MKKKKEEDKISREKGKAFPNETMEMAFFLRECTVFCSIPRNENVGVLRKEPVGRGDRREDVAS